MGVDDFTGRVAVQGSWLYDGRIPSSVEVVAFDCDFHFDRLPMDDGRVEHVRYPLNNEGLLYYLRFNGDVLPIPPFRTITEAMTWADRQTWGPVDWHTLAA